MSTRSFQRLGIAGLAALTVVGLLSGCSAKKKTASAATAPAGAVASAASAAGAAPPSDTPSKVVATGGGKFCQQVAASVNNSALKAAATGSGADSIKASVAAFHSLEGSVLKSAPGTLKPDLVTLFGALDQFYAGLAKANYDFTKVDPSIEAPLETPAVKAAETNVDGYIKNTCGIDVGGGSGGTNPSDQAAQSAAVASALARLTASPSS